MKKLNNFIKAEQLLNNYSLYEDNKIFSNYFTIKINDDYRPEGQKIFNISYFLIPLSEDKFSYNKGEELFLKENYFIYHGDKVFYPFFVHPLTEGHLKKWISNKYKFVEADKSIYIGTVMSSFRSLLVLNKNTNKYFIAKMSLFNNIANGSRHIDWNSAIGQYESCQIVKESLKNEKRIDFFEDIGAFGMTGDNSAYLSNKFKIVIGSRKIKTFGLIIRKIPKEFFRDKDNIIVSFASLTSLCKSESNYLSNMYSSSKKKFLNFFETDVFQPIFILLMDIFTKFGILLENHAQNLLIELDSNYKPTGKYFYRDFDLITLERARFPFYKYDMWIDYKKDRSDRITLKSNLEMRDNIGITFFSHFLGNIIYACIQSSIKQGFITKKEGKKYLYQKECYIKEMLMCELPKFNKNFKYKKWKPMKDFFSDIFKNEIPVNLKIIDKNNIDFSVYDNVILSRKYKSIDNFYISEDRKFIIGVKNDIVINLMSMSK